MEKKPVDANYSALRKKIESSYKDHKFKLDDRVKITKYKNILPNVAAKIGQENYLLLIMC